MGCKSGPSADQNAFGRNRYNRGASQPQQPHKSNSSGRVKPLTPLLARKKRMPSLTSSPVFGSQPGCEAREFTLHKAVPHRLCFDHHHKTLLFNRSLDHLHLSMPHRQTILCNRYQSHRMKSDVRHTSIYKSVLGLNETGGTLYLAYPLISKYVWTINN